MKNKLYFLLLSFAFVPALLCGQWSNKGFTFQGKARVYRVYVPAAYDPVSPAAMVITLHGLGDNMTNFSGIGMNYIADTANVIVVVPEAFPDALAGTAWNSGAGLLGYYPNANVDDVAFISALIDTVSAQYSINSKEVYACGFSMGGFMTQRLACQLNHKIRAFASVAGTFGSGYSGCNPQRPVCVVHFHGTSDQTVPYNGTNPGVSADSLVHFWVKNNECNETPITQNLPDTQNDGYTVEKFAYAGMANDAQVTLFKVNGAAHTWLTSANDISYTQEIWRFFRECKAQITDIETPAAGFSVIVSPNPTGEVLNIQLPEGTTAASLTVWDMTGKKVFSKEIHETQTSIDVKSAKLEKGFYFFTIHTPNGSVTQKVFVL